MRAWNGVSIPILLIPILLIGMLLGWMTPLAAHENHQTVAVTDAAKHLNEQCEIEFHVRSSRLLTDKNICFLNSEKDFRDPKNFTVVVRGEVLARFLRSGKDPAKHYHDKKIEVEGKVGQYGGRPQIIVENMKQIRIVQRKLPPQELTP